uniref:Uncharacterized protein n=1 Tax=Arcella intermedia TaxID=1963864 RepID=A0A6B2LNE4_9EUKA
MEYLLSLNIIFPPHLAPSLHATARSLDFQRRLHSISQKFHLRPSQSSLLSNHILLHSPDSAISPRLHAAHRTLEFSHLREELSHRLENRPEVGLLADLNILPSALQKNHGLACGLLPTMQVLTFKISKCQMEAKLGHQQRTTFYSF